MRARVSEASRPIRLRVVSRTHRATYEMPRTDARVDCLGGIPAHMLDGATLYVDGATSLEPGRVSVPATFIPEPITATRRT
jgi:hypothetical protein